MVDDTLTDAKVQVQYWQKQGTVAKAILADMARQRDAVQAYLEKLQKKFAEAKAAVADLIKNNKAMAGQIAKIQLDATRRIDERTRADGAIFQRGKLRKRGVRKRLFLFLEIITPLGIYDRDYYRRSQPGFSLRMPQSMVVTLIIINVALYLIDALFFPRSRLDG